MSTPNIELDPQADDQQLLAAVIAYYCETLKNTPEALEYLRKRGITNPQVIDHFRIGFADRSLGLQLPVKQVKAGEAIRTRLTNLGLYRSSGHENFRGSVTIPITTADGSGTIVDLYGRKIQKALRRGTPLHLNLNDQRHGVFNIQGFAGTQEIVLCGSIWDALTFWNHGFRNTTAMLGPDALTDDFLAAIREFGIKRVLTTSENITDKLLAAGIEVFTIKLPPGMDVNQYTREVAEPADALGALIRKAEWVGRGTTAATATSGQEVLAELLDLDDEVAEETPIEEPTEAEEQPTEEPSAEQPLRTASPVPSLPAEVPVDVREDEVVVTLGDRRYRVRGLGQNPTAHQLRVNILASNEHGYFVDTFDLYSAKHRRGFAVQAAEELGIQEQVIKKDLGRVLLALEEVQDANRANEKPTTPTVAMTTVERDAAMSLLRDPLLLNRIADAFAVVGDRPTKLLGYLAAVSRKLDTPLAVVVQSTSAAGKSTLMDAVLDLMPPEAVVRFSAMTGQSLYYMGADELKHKILALAEEEGARQASYALKLLQSEGELRIASTAKDSGGRMTTQEYWVAGPVGLFLTTTSITVDEELLNRCIVLTVDEGRDATAQIHELQRHRQTLDGLLSSTRRRETITLHRNAQRLLRSLPIVNPLAPRLTFPTGSTRTRRDHAKYLTLIRTLTLLHQHQRPIRTTEIDGKPIEYIETTVDDIRAANELMAVALSRSLDDLPPQSRKLLDLITEFVERQCHERHQDREDFRFGFRDLKTTTSWGDTQLKLHLRRLLNGEYLVGHRERHSRRLLFELADSSEPHGPTASWLADVAIQ